MLIKSERSCLLAIDIQEKLVPALHEAPQLVTRCAWLTAIAGRFEIPILASEQYPKGLGHTVAEVAGLLPADAVMEKVRFSCTAESGCMDRIDAMGRDQWVLMGAEAHVCVLQTALGLLKAGKEVYLVADCVSSRDPRNVELAFARMRAEGVRIVSREMVAFEWLYQAGTDRFREISREFLR